jgi:hypothetical protein
MHRMNKPDPILEFLKTLPEATEVWTEEEGRMSTPYSDALTWSRIIFGVLLSGKSFLRGPPGMWEKMEIRMASLSAEEKSLMYFDRDMLDDWIRAGLDAAPSPPAAWI